MRPGCGLPGVVGAGGDSDGQAAVGQVGEEARRVGFGLVLERGEDLVGDQGQRQADLVGLQRLAGSCAVFHAGPHAGGQGAGTQDACGLLVGDDQTQWGGGQDRLGGGRRGGQPVVGPVQQAGQLLGAEAAVGEQEREQQVRVGRAGGFRRGGFVLGGDKLVEGVAEHARQAVSSVRETARWSRSSSRSSR